MNVNSTSQLSNVSYNPSSQVTGLQVGSSSSYFYFNEAYGYDAQTGLLTSQSVHHIYTGTTSPLDLGAILDLSYGYARGSSNGSSSSGKTGQLTTISNNLDHNKDRLYEFDAIGRLKGAKAGTSAGAGSVTANWTQTYSYDRYGNKTGVSATGITSNSVSVPTDGLGSVGFDAVTNRINDSGWQYDNAGNLIRGKDQSGTWQRFEYDAAGRLVKIMDDSLNVLETYTYGSTRERLITTTSAGLTYYVWGGSSVIQEYTAATSTSTPAYSKANFCAGSRLFMSDTTGTINYYHPDRLGTKLITSNGFVNPVEQSTLPFGTELPGEESGTSSFNQKFTTYDRSAGTGLDYARNRTYSKAQSRFTQVDPLRSGSASITDPQSQNLYSYVENMPTDFVDPTGLMRRLWCIDYNIGDGRSIHECYEFDDPDPLPDRNPRGGGEPKKKKCTLQVRGKSGSAKSPNNPLKYPNKAPQTLGPAKSTERYGWNVEYVGTVRGGSLDSWNLAQVTTRTDRAISPDGHVTEETEVVNESVTAAGWTTRVGHTMYGLDSPGLGRGVDGTLFPKMSVVMNVRTILTNGKDECTVEWSMSLDIDNTTGKITGASFFPNFYH
jgi:RHS repeat-associated protein